MRWAEFDPVFDVDWGVSLRPGIDYRRQLPHVSKEVYAVMYAIFLPATAAVCKAARVINVYPDWVKKRVD